MTLSQAGIVLTATTITWTTGSWVQAHWNNRWPLHTFVRSGMLIVAAGIATFMLVLIPAIPVWIAVPTFALAGFGMGLTYSPLGLIMLREATPAEQGSASSALSLTDSLGTALGTGVSGAIVAAVIRADGQLGPWPGDRVRRRPPRDAVRGRPGRTIATRIARWQRPCPAVDCVPAPRPKRRRARTTGGPASMSAEELRAKIREIPDFPKPGILFYDITTLLKDPAAYKESIDLMLEPYQDEQVDIVVGMESRGFIFSAPMAYELNAGLVPVRKLGKLPAETITVEYALEYGSNTLEIHRDAIQPGQKVLIVDDLLATGGTVKGTIELIERLKGDVIGLAFLVELDFLKGRDRLEGRRVTSVVQY